MIRNPYNGYNKPYHWVHEFIPYYAEPMWVWTPLHKNALSTLVLSSMLQLVSWNKNFLLDALKMSKSKLHIYHVHVQKTGHTWGSFFSFPVLGFEINISFQHRRCDETIPQATMLGAWLHSKGEKALRIFAWFYLHLSIFDTYESVWYHRISCTI